MQSWRLGFLGLESIPPWLGEFEVEQFFRLSPAEIFTVKTRRSNESQLSFALHLGFLRMTGRGLSSSDVILWRILSFLGQLAFVFMINTLDKIHFQEFHGRTVSKE
jgi:Domain of unknown function (DUF4158)